MVICPFVIPGTEGFCHNGGAAGAEHEAHGGHDHQNGENQIHRREGGFAGEVGHKESIHHAVNGCENHHTDGWQGKPDQPPVGKMIG